MAGKHGGARPGSGRKSNGQIEEARKLMDKVCPAKRKEKLFRKLLELAEDGNVDAMKTWLGYRYGIPSQKVEVETALMLVLDE